jgi:hypothetical protein
MAEIDVQRLPASSPGTEQHHQENEHRRRVLQEPGGERFTIASDAPPVSTSAC